MNTLSSDYVYKVPQTPQTPQTFLLNIGSKHNKSMMKYV